MVITQSDGILKSLFEKVLDWGFWYVLSALGLAVLISIGWWNPRILRFVLANEAFQKLLWTGLKLRLAARAGRLFFAHALQAQKKNETNSALASFAKGIDVTETALREAEKQHVDAAPFQCLLDGQELAPLYAASAWVDAWQKDKWGRAIASADRAIQLDPQLVEGRIARGWAKLQRNLQSDVAEAEGDFDAVIRIGKQRGVPYLWALFGRAEALRLQSQYQKAVDEYTALEAYADQIPNIRACRGAAYYSLGNPAKCVDDLTWALAKHPDDHPYAAYRADALRLMSRLDEAIEECERIIERQPDHEQAYYVAGLALQQQTQQPFLPEARRLELLEDALKRIRAAKDIAVKHQRQVAVDIYNKLGEISNLLGRQEEAKRWFAEARTSPASSGMTSDAVAHASQLISGGPSSRLANGWARIQAWSLIRDNNELILADKEFAVAAQQSEYAASAYSGRAWLRYWRHSQGAGTLDEALSFSRLALQCDPKLGLPYYVRGWILVAKGLYVEAKTEFSRAIELGFGIYDAWFGLAEAERLLANYESAVASYTQAIQVGGIPAAEAWRLYYGRAQARAALRRWDEAFEDYRSAFEGAKKTAIEPIGLAAVYADYAWTCYELERDDEMEAAFQCAVEFGPRLIYVLLQLASVRLYSGKYDEAISYFSRAIALDQESGIAYVNRGLTHIYTGNLDTAFHDLDTAIDKNDKDAAAWRTRGWARLRGKEWQNATADLDRAIAFDSVDPFSFTDRALARWWRNDRDGALEDLHQLLKIKTSDFSVHSVERVREDAVTWGATGHDWSLAVERRPNDPLARLGRGVSRWLAGDLDGAEGDLGRANAFKAKLTETKWVWERVREERAKPLPAF